MFSDCFTIYSSDFANQLIAEGFPLVYIEKSMKPPKQNVYLFKDNLDLREAANRIMSEKREKKRSLKTDKSSSHENVHSIKNGIPQHKQPKDYE